MNEKLDLNMTSFEQNEITETGGIVFLHIEREGCIIEAIRFPDGREQIRRTEWIPTEYLH